MLTQNFKDMKKLFAVALGAALLGGLAVLGGARALGFFGARTAWQSPAFDGKVQFAGLNNTAAGGPVSADFTAAAAKTLPVVVHIQSASRQSERGVDANGGFDMQDLPAPFRDFFGPRFFQNPQAPRGSQRQKSDDGLQPLGTGSGVVISPDGYVVTNNHVVAGADELTVTLNDKRTFKAKVIGADPSTDLGLIKIDADGLPFVNFSSSDAVQVGQWVLAVGNPFNLNSTVTAGIVSAKGRDIHILQDKSPIESFIQTDAAINPGNSGGALVDLEGNLIGINSAIASPTGAYAGYGFAIPSNIVAKVVDDLKKYGVAQRGYLGVIVKEIDGKLAKERDLDITQGVLVDSLAEGSSAGAAGVRRGDAIVRIDGQPIAATSDLLEAVGRHRPGDKLAVTVRRGGSEKQFDVVLKNRQGNTEAVKKSSENDVLSVLGAEFQTISEKEAHQLGIAGGVRIASLDRGKLSAQTDVREGFVIVKVDGRAVKTVEELAAALDKKSGGVMLEGVYPDRDGSFYYAFGL